MAVAEDIIGTPGEVDLFTYDFIGQVDYVASVLGASNVGGTLPNPEVGIYDSAGTLLASNDDSFALGADPLLQFTAPFTGTYYIGVTDPTGGIGSYTLVVDQAGVPSPIAPPPPGAIF